MACRKMNKKCPFLWILVLTSQHDPLEMEVKGFPHSIHFFYICARPGLRVPHPMSAPGRGHNWQASSEGPTFHFATAPGLSLTDPGQPSPRQTQCCRGLSLPSCWWRCQPYFCTTRLALNQQLMVLSVPPIYLALKGIECKCQNFC